MMIAVATLCIARASVAGVAGPQVDHYLVSVPGARQLQVIVWGGSFAST